MNWPVAASFNFVVEGASESDVAVIVELMDDQSVHGVVHSWEAPVGALSLEAAGASMSIPLAAIRCIERRCVAAASQAHEPVLAFHLTFADGRNRKGRTQGYVNSGKGGLYLFVPLSAGGCRALWIPRRALAAVHLGPLPAPASGPAGDMPELFARIEEARHHPVITIVKALHELQLIDEDTRAQWDALDGTRLRPLIDEAIAADVLTQAQLELGRARVAGVPEADVHAFPIEPQATSRIPWLVAASLKVVPLGMVSETLYAACATPMDRELQIRLAMTAGCPVSLVWADAAQVAARLARELQAARSHEAATAVAGKAEAPAAKLAATSRPASLRPLHDTGAEISLEELLAKAQEEISVTGGHAQADVMDESSSVVQLVTRLITDAHRDKASDIHIETNTREQPSRVRFRKDGDLEEYLELPPDLRAAVVSRIKVMSKLDISERRRPQDGKINFSDFSDVKLELRVAILPTHDNQEDVVMRLLASSKPIPLALLGFSPRDEATVQRFAQRPYGLILACGPTGSGKTTSLHSLLAEINTTSRKIWTAEDPIEITQPGLRQLQVNPKIGVTFASAMRAFLRADPDVIMIGEVRDQETARISIEASLTGHLVLSTLHTNNAAESIVRLLDLGMDPMNFADSLVGIVAQRLVRALCKQCKVAEPVGPADLEKLATAYVEGTTLRGDTGRSRLLEAAGTRSGEKIRIYRAVGCGACKGKGYKGRTGIYEVLENGPELKHLIETRAHTAQVFDQAIASGMRSLKQDALEKMFQGTIDMDQAKTLFTQASSPLAPVES